MPDTTTSGLPVVTQPTSGNELIPGVQDGLSKRFNIREVGAVRAKALTADQASTSTTAAKVTGLDLATGTGTFRFTYRIRYRGAATTTGIKFDVNHSGTVTSFVWEERWADIANVATTTVAAAPDQDSVVPSVIQNFSFRTKGTTGRAITASVDTANADMLMTIEGIMVVTVAGDLQLYSGSEVAGSAATVMAGSIVELLRAA